MFLMSNSTKISIVFNKYKSKIVQLNFKIKMVSLLGNKDKFPPESLIICREILNPIPLPPSLVVKKGINMCSAMSLGMAGPLLEISISMASASLQ